MPDQITRIRIPAVVVRNPVQAVIDGLTLIHSRGGTLAVEAVLTAVSDILYGRENNE